VGKQGATTLGSFFPPRRAGFDFPDHGGSNLQQDFGLYSHALVDFVDGRRNRAGSESGRQDRGGIGWRSGATKYSVQARPYGKLQVARRAAARSSGRGRVIAAEWPTAFSVNYQDYMPDFTSLLGYNPELDRKGPDVRSPSTTSFEKGALENYSVSGSWADYIHHAGGFFHRGHQHERLGVHALWPLLRAGFSGQFSRRARFGYGLNRPFSRRTGTAVFGWNQKSLYAQGSIGDTCGRLAGAVLQTSQRKSGSAVVEVAVGAV